MDKLGIGILRELLIDESTLTLQADVRRPYRDIAKKVHTTEDTVRNRIRKMQDSGLIRGWGLGLNPTLFGYQMEYVQVDINPPSKKEDVIRMARVIPHVLGIQNYADNSVGVTLAYAKREDLDRVINELRRRGNSRGVFATKTPFLPCKMKLTETDWRIVKAIRRDPRKSFGVVAKYLGLSQRTVRRRAGRLLSGHAFWLLPELDLKSLDGVLAHLSVAYPPGSKSDVDRRVFQKHGASMVMGHSTLPEYSWFAFILPNPGAAKEIQAWASGLKGVTFAQVSVAEEIVYPPTNAFEQELKEAPRVLAVSGTRRSA